MTADCYLSDIRPFVKFVIDLFFSGLPAFWLSFFLLQDGLRPRLRLARKCLQGG